MYSLSGSPTNCECAGSTSLSGNPETRRARKVATRRARKVAARAIRKDAIRAARVVQAAQIKTLKTSLPGKAQGLLNPQGKAKPVNPQSRGQSFRVPSEYMIEAEFDPDTGLPIEQVTGRSTIEPMAQQKLMQVKKLKKLQQEKRIKQVATGAGVFGIIKILGFI